MSSKPLSRLIPLPFRPSTIFSNPSFLHPSHPFSTSARHSLATPMRSPKARAAERARKHPIPSPNHRPPPTPATSQEPSLRSNAQSSAWPVQILAAAHTTGSLPLAPTEAIPFLERFSALLASRSATTQAVEQLCEGDHAVSTVLLSLRLISLRVLYPS